MFIVPFDTTALMKRAEINKRHSAILYSLRPTFQSRAFQLEQKLIQNGGIPSYKDDDEPTIMKAWSLEGLPCFESGETKGER